MTAGPAVDGLEARVYTVPTDAPEADGTITWDSTTMVLVRVTSGAVSGLGWTYAAGAAAGVVHDALEPEVLGHGAFEVPVYGSGGFTAYDAAQLDHQLAGWVEQGIPRVKIKIGESWGRNASRDIARIRQTRSRVGDHTDIYVDANGGYSRKQAIRVMERARDLDVRWFEEPVSSDDLDGLRQVREAVLPDVAAGEYAYDVPYVRKMCQAGAVDCMQADATRIGGITEWLRAAAVADSFGLHLSGHCAPHLHVAAAMAVPNLRHLEWFHDHVRIESMFFDGALDPSGGGVRPADDRPGLGLDLKESDAQAYRVA